MKNDDAMDAKTMKMAGANCPHPEFVRKHQCKHCVTDDDCLQFSKHSRSTGYPTNVNSVIMGDPGFESTTDYQGRSVCENVNPVKVVKCTLNQGRCILEGNQCTTRHHTGNGHLFYRDTDCQ